MPTATKETPGIVEADGKVMHYDGDKVRLDLIDPEWVMGIGQVLTFGAKKYEANLWRRGMRWGSIFGSALRHTWKFWRGEQLDEDSGLHHLLHAATCILFLYTYDTIKVGEDDRAVSSGK